MTVKALLLHDDSDMYHLCSIVLEMVCGQCVYANNISQASSILKSDTIDILIMDYYNDDREWQDAYENLKTDLAVRTAGVILWLPKINWISAETSRNFYLKLYSFGIKSLVKPFGPEALLAQITEILKEQGKPLMTQEQLEMCLERNRARLKHSFECSDEDLEEKYKAWISCIETNGVHNRADKIRLRGTG